MDSSLQWISLAVIVSGGLFFILLERLKPYNDYHRPFGRAFWTDIVCYGILQSYVLGLIISKFITFIDGTVVGHGRWRLVSAWPVWTQVLFFLVLHDFVTYLFHRTQHRSKWLWRTHETHHSLTHIDWLAGVRSHWSESLLLEPLKFLPLVVLGASPEVPLYRAMIDSVWGMWIHSNLNVRLGPLSYVLVGPELHRWHHADALEAYDKNFATKFAFWDRFFGTAYNPPDRRATSYGLGDPTYPQGGYWRQFFYVFRPFEKSRSTDESRTDQLSHGGAA